MNRSLLKHYTKALFEESVSKDKLEQVYKDLSFVVDSLKKEEQLNSFLDSRQVPLDTKYRVLNSVYKNKVETITLGYLLIITKKHLTKYLPIMKEDFRHMYNHKKGIIEGLIYSAYPLKMETIHKLENIFSDKYKKQVTFRVVPDSRVIAGMKININDTLYDYSIDSKIENIKKKLVYTSD